MIMMQTKNGYSLTATDKAPDTLLIELSRAIMVVAGDIVVATGKSQEKVFDELIKHLQYGDKSTNCL